MTILSVNEVWRGESWSDDSDGGREYTRLFQIQSDDPNESAVAVRAAMNLPGTPYPDDNAALCKTRSATRDDQSRYLWNGEAKYEYKPNETEESPLDKPPKIRWTSALVMRPVLRDRNGKACVNSAGEYFDPPLEGEFPRWTANIQFNAAVVPAETILYAGAINNSGVTIDGLTVVEERARIIALDIGEETVENEVTYRPITMAVECRDAADESFDLEPLDQGYRIKDGDDVIDALIKDEQGNFARPSSPVQLDGSGHMLANPNPDTCVFLHFEIPRRLDFTVFPAIT